MKTTKKVISLVLTIVMLFCMSSLFAQAKETAYYSETFIAVSLDMLKECLEEEGYVNKNNEYTFSYSLEKFDSFIVSEYDGIHFYGFMTTDSATTSLELIHDKKDYTRADVTVTSAYSTWSYTAHAKVDLLNYDKDAKNIYYTFSSSTTFNSEMRAAGNKVANGMLSMSFDIWELILKEHYFYISEFGFSNYCPGHTKTLDYDSEEATCSTPGTHTTLCAYCGLIMKEETIPAGSHQWNAGVVTKQSSCEEAGTITYTCQKCGATKTEAIPAGSHQWDAGVVTKQASCGEAGTKTYTCQKCGATKTEAIPAGSHQWNAGVVTKQASCSKAGVVTFTCQNCGEIRIETIPKESHIYASTITPATRNRNGRIVASCSICGAVKSTKQIDRIDKVSLSKTSYVYDGSAKTPKVTVTDAKGNVVASKYYTVKYANGRAKIGTYSVKITFKGRYSSTVTCKFKIVPGRITDLKGASSKAGVAKLTWSSVNGAQRYAIYAAESKNGVYERVATTKRTAFNVKDLTSGRKAYFIVKALTNVDGKNYYSARSNIAAVKVK